MENTAIHYHSLGTFSCVYDEYGQYFWNTEQLHVSRGDPSGPSRPSETV